MENKILHHSRARAILFWIAMFIGGWSNVTLAANNFPVVADTIETVCFAGKTIGVNLQPSAVDPDGGLLTFTLGTPSVNGLITTEITGRMTFNITASCTPGQRRDVYFMYFISDTSSTLPTVATTSGVVKCTVIDSQSTTTNLPPLANDDYFLVDSGVSSLINIYANDVDMNGDGLTAAMILSTPLTAVAVVSGKNITLLPQINFVGTDSFTYMICDTLSAYNPFPLCDTAKVVVYVRGRNQNISPAAADDIRSAKPNTTLVIDVLQNDFDQNGDSLQVTVLNSPVLVNSQNQLVYTQNFTQSIIDTIIYFVCDYGNSMLVTPLVQCDTARVVVMVADPINANAVVNNVTCFGGSNGSIILNTRGGFAPYSYNWSNGSTTNSLTGLAVGTYLVTVTDRFCTSATFSFTITQPQPLSGTTNTIGNVSCFGGNDGFATFTVTGGVPPYTFIYNGNPVIGTLANLTAGSYTCLATDANGCQFSINFSITEPPQLVANTSTVSNVSCFGGNDGFATFSIIGGTPPYTITYNGNPVTDTLRNLTAGSYTCLATDANGCQAAINFNVTEPSAITFAIGNDTTVCAGQSVAFGDPAGASGGTGAKTYAWSIGATNPQIIVDFAGTYTVTVTDQNSCTASFSAQLAISTFSDAITSPQNDTLVCGAPVSITFTQQNSSAQTAQWDFGNGQSSNALSPTTTYNTANQTYTVQLISANALGCADTAYRVIAVSNGCVYPGDADNNGVVDNNDLLPIGLAFDTSGPARSNTSIVWAANYATDWSDTTIWNVNRKYADCDGSGTINAQDTLAISQNWGLTHAKKNEPKPFRSGLPALAVVLPTGPFVTGDSLIASLQLGDVNQSAQNVYGLAFTFNYNNTAIDTTQTKMRYKNSWLATLSQQINISKDFPSLGYIKSAVSRIDRNSRSGSGEIATVKMVINTDNLDGKNYAALDFIAFVSDLRAVDVNGDEIEMNEGIDTATVNYLVSSIDKVEKPIQLSVYPNPANQFVKIAVDNSSIRTIQLTNSVGQVVKSYSVWGAFATIDIADLAQGNYIIEVLLSNGQKQQSKLMKVE